MQVSTKPAKPPEGVTLGRQYGRHFNPKLFKEEIIPTAVMLRDQLGATNLRCYYDDDGDFHRIDFMLEGQLFKIRRYKLWALDHSLAGKAPVATWHHNTQIINFFRMGRHKEA